MNGTCFACHRVTVRCVHTSPEEYPMTFKGTVGTPSVVLGHGNCFQTARLESQRRGCFVRKLATFQDTGVGKGCNSSYFNPARYLCRPRTLYLSFVGVRYVEGSQILKNKPRLSEPFWNRHVLYLALRLVTVIHCMGSKQFNNPWSLAPVTSLKPFYSATESHSVTLSFTRILLFRKKDI